MMRAAWFERRGPARDVLQVGTMPIPEPAAGEVRVRVHVSAVNPSDTKTRSGWGAPAAMPFPRIVPHQDGAGTIDAVGPGVTDRRAGERVWVYEAQFGRPFGTAAEYVVVPARRAVPLPDTASFETGATLGIPALTAHRALFADGPVNGLTVLVTGAAGAVGLRAVQWARWGGAARVVATVRRSEQTAVAREAGAHDVLVADDASLAEAVNEALGSANRVDRLVDVDLGAHGAALATLLAQNATASGYASPAPDAGMAFTFRPLMALNATLRLVFVYQMPETAKAAAIADIDRALRDGALAPRIAGVFELDRIVEAHEAQDARPNGKLLVKP